MAPDPDTTREAGNIGRLRKKSVTACGAATAAARASFLAVVNPVSDDTHEQDSDHQPGQRLGSKHGGHITHQFSRAFAGEDGVSPPAAGSSPRAIVSPPAPRPASRGEDGSLLAAAAEDGSLLAAAATSAYPPVSLPSRPTSRLYTLGRNDLVYDSSVGVAPDGSMPGRSATALSVRSAPSGESRNSPRSSEGLKAASAGASEKAKNSARCRSLCGTPAWSFRYAELMGSIISPEAVDPKTGSKRAPTKTLPKVAPVDSVFLAKNGRDKRLPAQEEMLEGRTKASRLQGRRIAICGVGPTKMQVRTAVKIWSQKHPDQMRKLARKCENMTGKGKIQVNLKHLDASNAEVLMERTGLSEDEVNNLYVSFNRYDIDDSGYLDRTEIRQVLCDLGLQPRGCDEKVEVHEIICDADEEGLRHYKFEEFVVMIKAVRERLRQIQLGECMVIFEDADQDGNGFLCMEEVLVLIDKKLHMRPRTQDERSEVASMFQACDGDNDGQVCFEEFQDFVQQVRAKLIMMRREEELTIAKAFDLANLLSPDVVAEFRMDLPQVWAIFNRYDRKGRSTVSRNDLIGIIIDVGLCPQKPQNGCDKMQAALNLIDCYGKEDLIDDKGNHWPQNDFPTFLTIAHQLRTKSKLSKQDELLRRFQGYDRYKLGELHYSEVYQMLADFKMLPKSDEEQQGIVSVMERLDTDGSGSFDFDEFQDFFQRLTEQGQMTEREGERQLTLAMGFTEYQLQVMRTVFLSLNPNPQTGKIAQIGLVSGVHRTKEDICPTGVDEQSVREITRNAQSAPERGITFQEFAQSLKMMVPKKEDEEE